MSVGSGSSNRLGADGSTGYRGCVLVRSAGLNERARSRAGVLRVAELRDRLRDLGYEPVGSMPAEFDQL